MGGRKLMTEQSEAVVAGDVGTGGQTNTITDITSSLKGIPEFLQNINKTALTGPISNLGKLFKKIKNNKPSGAENEPFGLQNILDLFISGDAYKKWREEQEKAETDKNKYADEAEAMRLAGLNPYSMFAGGNMVNDSKKEKEDKTLERMLMLLLMKAF